MADKDLDAILNDAAKSVIESTVKPAAAPPSAVPAEIKPWLASSANVPKEFRDKWTSLVKVDRSAALLSALQPSNAYRSWESPPLNTSKIVYDLVRKTCAQPSCAFDEGKTSKLVASFSPTIETDYSKQLQAAYAKQMMQDLRAHILSDPNYDPARFPQLATALAK